MRVPKKKSDPLLRKFLREDWATILWWEDWPHPEFKVKQVKVIDMKSKYHQNIMQIRWLRFASNQFLSITVIQRIGRSGPDGGGIDDHSSLH